MESQLQKALRVARKTGDKVIVFDQESDSSFVVMPLEDYERLAEKRSEVQGLTEREMIDKINRDIALWKSDQEFFDDELREGEENEEKDEFPVRKKWAIPDFKKEAAEEIVDEERYFEEIKY